MTEGTEDVPAGWYPDPDMASTQRYWDGKDWTSHVAPLTDVARPAMPPQPVAAGTAVVDPSLRSTETFAIVMAFLIPIVGFVMGLTLIGKSDIAWKIVALSIGVGVVWYAFITA